MPTQEQRRQANRPATGPATQVVGTQATSREWRDSGVWVKVESSNVKGIRYDAEARKLYVEFLGKGGPEALYVYHEVPPQTAEDMFNAESLGKFVWNRLRDKYIYNRLR